MPSHLVVEIILESVGQPNCSLLQLRLWRTRYMRQMLFLPSVNPNDAGQFQRIKAFSRSVKH